MSKQLTMRINVTGIVDEDVERTLFSGERVEDGAKVTFHLARPGSNLMAAKFRAGVPVVVELPVRPAR